MVEIKQLRELQSLLSEITGLIGGPIGDVLAAVAPWVVEVVESAAELATQQPQDYNDEIAAAFVKTAEQARQVSIALGAAGGVVTALAAAAGFIPGAQAAFAAAGGVGAWTAAIVGTFTALAALLDASRGVLQRVARELREKNPDAPRRVGTIKKPLLSAPIGSIRDSIVTPVRPQPKPKPDFSAPSVPRTPVGTLRPLVPTQPTPAPGGGAVLPLAALALFALR